MTSMRLLRIPAGLVLLGWLAGCGGEAANPSSVGVVEGTDAVVGVVASAEKVTLYVCGGASTYSTMTRWFSGAPGAPLANQGWTATVDAGLGQGTLLTPEGKTLTW